MKRREPTQKNAGKTAKMRATAQAVEHIETFDDQEVKVTVREGTATLSLYGNRTLSYDGEKITIHKEAVRTKKSCRYINAILEHTTGERLKTINGRWHIKKQGQTKATPIEENEEFKTARQ